MTRVQRVQSESQSHRKRAVAVVMVAVLLPVLLGFAALTIDLGVMYNTRADLQRAADAGALAAAEAMTNGDRKLDRVTRARKTAMAMVERNLVLGAKVTLGDGDIVFGRTSFDEGANAYTFTPGEFGADAVRVTVRRTAGSANGPTPLFFAALFGKHHTDISASATAAMTPRDIALIVDLSRSTSYDSQLQHAHLTDVNIHEVWSALPGGYNEVDSDWTDDDIKPEWLNINGSVPQAAGPAWGYFKEMGFGDETVDPSYNPVMDGGLVYMPRNANWNDANLRQSLVERGYSDAEINAVFSDNYDGSNGYDERVAVALGFAEWRSGRAGGMADVAALGGGNGNNRLESSELVWTESIMGRSVAESRNIFRAYINNYVSSSNTPMTKANADFRYRYGAKTFVDFLLEIRETNEETPELSDTPTQPLESIKEAVAYMVDLFESIDSNDQLSLEIYATASMHEENLSHDYRVVLDRLQGMQPGHYDSWTNMGAGIEEAITELASDRGRSTARKVLVLLTDGNANVNRSGGFSYSGGADYALDAARVAAQQGYRIFAVTVGAGADQDLMKQIAEITNGEHFHAEGSIDEYREQLSDIFQEIGSRKVAQLIF